MRRREKTARVFYMRFAGKRNFFLIIFQLRQLKKYIVSCWFIVFIHEKKVEFLFITIIIFFFNKKLIPHIANVCKLLIYGNERSFERSWPAVGLCITNNRCRRRRFRNMRWEGNWIRVQFSTTNI